MIVVEPTASRVRFDNSDSYLLISNQERVGNHDVKSLAMLVVPRADSNLLFFSLNELIVVRVGQHQVRFLL